MKSTWTSDSLCAEVSGYSGPTRLLAEIEINKLI